MPARLIRDSIIRVYEVPCTIVGGVKQTQQVTHRIAMMASGRLVMLDHTGGFTQELLLWSMQDKPQCSCHHMVTVRHVARHDLPDGRSWTGSIHRIPYRPDVPVSYAPQILTTRLRSAFSVAISPLRSAGFRRETGIHVSRDSHSRHVYWDEMPGGALGGTLIVGFVPSDWRRLIYYGLDTIYHKEGEDAELAIAVQFLPLRIIAGSGRAFTCHGLYVDPTIKVLPNRIQLGIALLNLESDDMKPHTGPRAGTFTLLQSTPFGNQYNLGSY